MSKNLIFTVVIVSMTLSVSTTQSSANNAITFSQVKPSSEFALCVAARKAIDWARRVGEKVKVEGLDTKQFVIVDDFNANGEQKLRRPKKADKKRWKELKELSNAPLPSTCSNLDTFVEAPIFVGSISEAQQYPQAVVFTFVSTRIAQSNEHAAMMFNASNRESGKALTGMMTPFKEGNEWKLGPQMLQATFAQ